MSDRHAATPPFAIEIAPEIGAVPASVEAFQAALKAERDNVLAELQASLHEQNEAYRHALRSELRERYISPIIVDGTSLRHRIGSA